MKSLPFDMVADWRAEPESLLPDLAKDLAALGAVLALCGAIAAVASLFA